MGKKKLINSTVRKGMNMRLKMKERMMSTVFIPSTRKIHHQWIKGLTSWTSS